MLKWGVPGGGIKSAKVALTPYVYYPPACALGVLAKAMACSRATNRGDFSPGPSYQHARQSSADRLSDTCTVMSLTHARDTRPRRLVVVACVEKMGALMHER